MQQEVGRVCHKSPQISNRDDKPLHVRGRAQRVCVACLSVPERFVDLQRPFLHLFGVSAANTCAVVGPPWLGARLIRHALHRSLYQEERKDRVFSPLPDVLRLVVRHRDHHVRQLRALRGRQRREELRRAKETLDHFRTNSLHKKHVIVGAATSAALEEQVQLSQLHKRDQRPVGSPNHPPNVTALDVRAGTVSALPKRLRRAKFAS